MLFIIYYCFTVKGKNLFVELKRYSVEKSRLDTTRAATMLCGLKNLFNVCNYLWGIFLDKMALASYHSQYKNAPCYVLGKKRVKTIY